MLKLSIAGALVVGAVAVWQLGGGLAAPPQPQATATVSTPAPVAASNAQLGGQTDAPRTVVDVAAFPCADLAHAFAFALRCMVVDDHGLPVSGARIALWPLGGADNTWPETTDAAGTVTLRWTGRAATAHMALRVGDGITRAIDVAAGAEGTAVLLGESSERGLFRFRLFGAHSTPAPATTGHQANAKLDMSSSLSLGAAHGKQVIESRITAVNDNNGAQLQPQRGMHPEQVFADLATAGTAGNDGLALLGDIVRAREAVVRLDPGQHPVNFTIQVSDLTVADSPAKGEPAPADDRGTVAGTVFGEDGKPAANVLVCWSQQPDLPLGRTQSRSP